MDKYDKLKKVIAEANPEIMELKRGAILKRGGSEFIALARITDDIALCYNYIHGGVDAERIDTCQILGRPIRLADVLLAINKILGMGEVFMVDSEGYITWSDPEVETRYATWNLKDDNLDNQSEETKKFLIELLV